MQPCLSLMAFDNFPHVKVIYEESCKWEKKRKYKHLQGKTDFLKKHMYIYSFFSLQKILKKENKKSTRWENFFAHVKLLPLFLVLNLPMAASHTTHPQNSAKRFANHWMKQCFFCVFFYYTNLQEWTTSNKPYHFFYNQRCNFRLYLLNQHCDW